MINRPEEARKHRSGNAKAVFLDRNGVLNQRAQEHEYIRSVSEFRILPGVPEAISRLTSAGLLVLVVTNQRGIARELVSNDEIERMHEFLRTAIEGANGRIEKVYICPHDYKDECNCRKPGRGMLVRAQREYDIDLSNSWMVGDSESDAAAGEDEALNRNSVDG